MKYFENLGIIAIVGVWISLTVWGMLQGILDSRSLFASAVIVVIWIGVLILLIAAMVRRYKESKNDPYKDVEI
jgi:high-affinity Fe2+/Pb2+ permease